MTDMKEPKYKSLAELKAAYESGELDGESSPLVLDEEALTLLGIPWDFA